MVRRLEQHGHDCVGYDLDAAAVDTLAADGATGAHSLDDLVAALDTPRHIWVMVPAAFVDDTIARLAPLLSPGDSIIDGGNSWYRDDLDRVGAARRTGHPLPRRRHVGRRLRTRARLLPDDRWRHRRRRSGSPRSSTRSPRAPTPPSAPLAAPATRRPEERGWLHCGPTGAGHFVKMVHNGIEYGMMAAYAEGLNVLAKANIGSIDHARTPRRRRSPHAAVLPLRPRPGGDHRGVAPWQRRRQLAARPHRRGPPRRPAARRVTPAP